MLRPPRMPLRDTIGPARRGPAGRGPGSGGPSGRGLMCPRRQRGAALLAALAAAPVAGCTVDSGVVELNWAFVDRDGDPIFPAGQFSVGRGDACDLPGSGGVDLDLEIELDICDASCGGSCDGDCRITEPERGHCDSARATLRDVPASEDPYLFFLRAVIVTPASECTAVPSDCIAVPGPRERTVRRGLVTDLQVLQLVVDVDLDADEALDLEDCGCA